jgi:hypothetical protein
VTLGVALGVLAASAAQAPRPKPGAPNENTTAVDRPAAVTSAASAPAGKEKDKGPPLDERPYRIRAWVAVAPSARMDERGRQALIAGWRDLVARFVGTPWDLHVDDGPGPLLGGPLAELKAEAVAPQMQGYDKAWLIEVGPHPDSHGLVLRGREFDSATGQLGLLMARPARVPDDAPRALLNLALDLFAPTAEIGKSSLGGVLIRVQGASLPAANPVGRVVRPGSVFHPVRVFYRPDGSILRVMTIPRTYLQVEALVGPEARCRIISKLRDPLTRMVRGKYKVVAVGLKPTALPTRLRYFTAPPENRPAAGYTVLARPMPDGPWRVVGTTDREGRVTLEPRFVDGLAAVRLVAAGVEPLDEMLIVPGERDDEILITGIDPKPEAVALETSLLALRDTLLDQAAERSRLLRLIEPRVQAENWDEVRFLLDEAARLPRRDAYATELDALEEQAKARQLETRRPVLTRPAQNLLRETRSILERYVNDTPFAEFEDAYTRYAATAPPEKARARTLPTERPEAALSRLAVSSAASASQEEAKAGLVEFTPRSPNLRVALPPGGPPAATTRETTLSSGLKVTQHVLTLDDPERGRFTIAYFDLDRPPTRESAIAKALDNARGMFLSEGRRARVIAERPLSMAGYPGREVEVQIPAAQEGGFKTLVRGRAFLVGNRFYTISVVGNEAQVRARLAELFLDSFRPLDAPPAPTPIADTPKSADESAPAKSGP